MSVNKLVLDLKSSSRFTQSSLHNQNTIENNYAGKLMTIIAYAIW